MQRPSGRLAFGTSSLGSMPNTYGYSVDPDQAKATIHTILDGGPCIIDSSRNYGDGRSEALIGEVLADRGGPPDGATISTKVDRDMTTNVFDGRRVRQSFEQSLSALGLDRVNVLHLHDPEYAADLNDVTGAGGAVDELFRIRDEGLTDRVGLAMGRLDLMATLFERYRFDVALNHNRYTLLNRSAGPMFATIVDAGAEVWNAAPYAGGVLAKGADAVKQITYQPATDEQLQPVRELEQMCARFEVPLGAAALQFSMRDPLVTTTVIGVSKPERVALTLAWADAEIPDEFWTEIASVGFSTEDPEADRVYDPG